MPVQAIKAWRGSGGTSPLIPNCGRQLHDHLHAPVPLPPVHTEQEAGLDALEKRKVSYSQWEIEPRFLTCTTRSLADTPTEISRPHIQYLVRCEDT
jgi:hypothetical protein